MGTNFPNGVSSYGVPVIGSGESIPVTTGSYFWVSSVTGSVSNTGATPQAPLATIAQALAKCVNANSDVIIVLPGHAETVSAAGGLNINKSGVRIIGLGQGGLVPTITLNTAATATITVTAANVTLKNFIVTANYADIAGAIVVSATDCRLEAISFRETDTGMNFLSCIKTGTVDNGADGLTVVNCERLSIDAAALAFISILGNCNRLRVEGCFDNQSSAADVGHFIIMAAKVCLGARIIGNVLNLNGDNNAQTVGVFMTGSSTTSTGTVAYNLVNDLDATTELFDTATLDFGHFENRMTGTIAKSGYVLPAIDA